MNKWYRDIEKELEKTGESPASEVCKFCDRTILSHYVMDGDGNLKIDDHGTLFKIKCREEKEHLLEKYFFNDDLKDISDDSIPEKTPLSQSISVSNKKLRIASSWVHSDYQSFLPHFKSFLYEIVYTYKIKSFSYETIDVTKLLDIKFDRSPKFKTYDALYKYPLILFHLSLDPYENKMTLDNIKEFLERRIKPVWFISNTPELNRQLDHTVKNKITSLDLIQITPISSSVKDQKDGVKIVGTTLERDANRMALELVQGKK